MLWGIYRPVCLSSRSSLEITHIYSLIFIVAFSLIFKVKYDHNGFEVSLDVQNFVPAELEVKVTGNRLVVSGKHEQRADQHGFVAREFHREFEIPEVLYS